MLYIYSSMKLVFLMLYTFINNLFLRSVQLLKQFSLYFFQLNIFSTKYFYRFTIFYIMYLVLIVLFLEGFSFINLNVIFIYFTYIQLCFGLFVFYFSTTLYNLVIVLDVVKYNTIVLYQLLDLNNFYFNNLYSLILDLNICDFFQFVILNFFIDLKIFFFELFENFSNYPFFILFAVLFLATSFFSLLSLSYLGFYGVFILNFVSLFSLWLSVIPYFLSIFSHNNFYYISLGKWMYLNTNFKINFDFLVDNISLSFSFLTLTIAIFVYLYTFSYFRYEPLVDRLIIFLNLFIISMVFLVSSGNLVMLFLGWEMIGLTSFFLINFWSTRVGTLKAAFKAFSFNKTSDLFLFFAILLIYNTLYTLDICIILVQISFYKNYLVNFLFFNVNLIDLIALFFLGCAFIKSAQIGAHIWLPDSMEAPVPASSLIHSATLVSAGIFILLRFSVLFELSNFAFTLIAVVGSITAFYGGLVSMYQSDTKKILAYSTISHCGFLMVVYTTGVIEYTLLYLYIHGFFKAAIFMSVGNVNRYSRNNQDFKKMGNYYKYLPFDCLMCFIGLINLSGLPFTLGFYIKHLLFVGLNSNMFLYNFIQINCLFGAFTGLFYSYRLFFNVFFDFKKGKKKLYLQSSELNLKSKFYSNTTILGNLAIIGLLIISYIISFYFFYYYTNKDLNFSNFSSYLVWASFIDNFVSTKNFLFNVSYLNWIVLILLCSIFFTPWRKLAIKYKYIDVFYWVVLYSFSLNFFYFFFNL